MRYYSNLIVVKCVKDSPTLRPLSDIWMSMLNPTIARILFACALVYSLANYQEAVFSKSRGHLPWNTEDRQQMIMSIWKSNLTYEQSMMNHSNRFKSFRLQLLFLYGRSSTISL